jgi:hypothetical protein
MPSVSLVGAGCVTEESDLRVAATDTQASAPQAEYIVNDVISGRAEEPCSFTPKFGVVDGAYSPQALAAVSSSQSAIMNAETADDAADAAVALLLM